jgi:hypothetical protein
MVHVGTSGMENLRESDVKQVLLWDEVGPNIENMDIKRSIGSTVVSVTDNSM